MPKLNYHGVARAFPDLRQDVDYHLVDLHDGKGVQVIWLAEFEQPDMTAAEAATAEWQAEQDAIAYRDKRAAEYPLIQDFIDAQVKKASSDPVIKQEGVQQETLYIAACAAIKAKYPKGTA